MSTLSATNLKNASSGSNNIVLGTGGDTTITNNLTVSGTGNQSIAGTLQFNSGYGSAATAYGCRAWVNFQGTGSGTFAGGTSTVTRTAGSTTATVTTTNAHGLITGNTVYALTGVAAGLYTVTVLTSTTFTITTVATTALSAVSITFAVNTIRASGNVSSITDNGNGNYAINFATAMPDANYSCVASASGVYNGTVISTDGADGATIPRTNTSITIRTIEGNGGTLGAVDPVYVSVAIFR